MKELWSARALFKIVRRDHFITSIIAVETRQPPRNRCHFSRDIIKHHNRKYVHTIIVCKQINIGEYI